MARSAPAAGGVLPENAVGAAGTEYRGSGAAAARGTAASRSGEGVGVGDVEAGDADLAVDDVDVDDEIPRARTSFGREDELGRAHADSS